MELAAHLIRFCATSPVAWIMACAATLFLLVLVVQLHSKLVFGLYSDAMFFVGCAVVSLVVCLVPVSMIVNAAATHTEWQIDSRVIDSGTYLGYTNEFLSVESTITGDSRISASDESYDIGTTTTVEFVKTNDDKIDHTFREHVKERYDMFGPVVIGTEYGKHYVVYLAND